MGRELLLHADERPEQLVVAASGANVTPSGGVRDLDAGLAATGTSAESSSIEERRRRDRHPRLGVERVGVEALRGR